MYSRFLSIGTYEIRVKPIVKDQILIQFLSIWKCDIRCYLAAKLISHEEIEHHNFVKRRKNYVSYD